MVANMAAKLLISVYNPLQLSFAVLSRISLITSYRANPEARYGLFHFSIISMCKILHIFFLYRSREVLL